ncbi:hypothetical protein JHW43_002452, partial [Diplocarpon mali]
GGVQTEKETVLVRHAVRCDLSESLLACGDGVRRCEMCEMCGLTSEGVTREGESRKSSSSDGDQAGRRGEGINEHSDRTSPVRREEADDNAHRHRRRGALSQSGLGRSCSPGLSPRGGSPELREARCREGLERRWEVGGRSSSQLHIHREEGRGSTTPPARQARLPPRKATTPGHRARLQGCKDAPTPARWGSEVKRACIAAAHRVVSVDRLSRPETRPAFAAVCISVPQQCHVTQPDLESSRPQPIDRRYRGLPDASSKQPPGHQRYADADADADADPSLRVVACSGRSAGPNSSEEPTRWDTSAITPATPESRKPLLQVLTKLTPHENIYTVPNLLTFSRLTAAPVVGYLVLHDHHAWAVGLFAYAGITDLVDGYIARRWNLQTVVGTVIDPMADKTLMTILTVCLAIKGALPVWLAVIILGRDAGLAVTAIYYRWISLPPPKTFARYWDFSLPSAEVHPTTISKYNTALQLALIGATTAMPLVTVDVSVAMTAMQYLVATTTVWSGASYIYSKDAVKILNQVFGVRRRHHAGELFVRNAQEDLNYGDERPDKRRHRLDDMLPVFKSTFYDNPSPPLPLFIAGSTIAAGRAIFLGDMSTQQANANGG